MHIAFVIMGAFGHVNPTLPIAAELTARGVRVTYFTTERFRETVEKTGAKFVPASTVINGERQQGTDAGKDIVAEIPFRFLSEADAMIVDILPVMKQDIPDAVIHDFASIAGKLAASYFKIPDIQLFPSAPATAGHSNAEGFLRVPETHPARIKAAEIAERFTKLYGVPKIDAKEIFDGHGDLNIVTLLKRLCPGSDSLDDSYIFTGVQVIPPRQHTIDLPVDGKPLVYSSLGTVFNGWKEYYPILFKAFGGESVNVFAGLGPGITPESLGSIPKNITAQQIVPQLELLERADVFITHAGMGGLNEAIYFGVPMVAIPQMPEQQMNAGLIAEQGLGISFPDKEAVTPEKLRDAVMTVYKDPKYRKKLAEYSREMKAAGGCRASADAIMNYCGKTRVSK
jgi:MGT family glycosyltransferase